MLAPKEAGGGGIGALCATNQALLLKWWFSYKTERNKLWVDVGEEVEQLGLDIRWYIRSQIGNGENTLFWLDNWTGKGILKNLLPDLYKLEGYEQPDKWMWSGEIFGPYLCSIIRKVIGVMFPQENTKFPWLRGVPLKVSSFAWRACLNRIPTKEALSRRGILVNQSCALCTTQDEVADQ
ncbi:hypothetical protein E3N88_00261 [Mikania micrantha]|uniref:Reverse transcriptase zinc-binding domain-containing protein n=1 Tax=Mikania micrantha TaxID=192012 RepID=A0A5N6PXJ1_9ASTR|nr:hypothetical protein E3N88_00261 [Mikania micrantha]